MLSAIDSFARRMPGDFRCFAKCAMLAATLTLLVHATENGVSVYPAGVETILPGLIPGPGGTMFEEFNNFYQTNQLADSQGRSLIPGFHLRVAAVAGKLVHNWGVHVLGGTLVSTAALPLLYEHLDAPFGKATKTGFGNPDLEPFAVAYHSGDWHWWYGFDVYTPGFSYHRNDLLNSANTISPPRRWAQLLTYPIKAAPKSAPGFSTL